ncbi:DUF1611 domain-containing protein [Thioalkalivibrio sp. XN279]|uniref:DUF1611 domain-containing protein n=1 Tax=Thioalkalivibrio sp. XN279 TaxID=2714953 RepID=UPI00140D00D1|nr:DUF1611 domain-containing protein [Thioalkalivibrio sp. XN279]NHA13639.1 DUF1611 domain-containing protein [Thioalkalivibrio sp. XN279]
MSSEMLMTNIAKDLRPCEAPGAAPDGVAQPLAKSRLEAARAAFVTRRVNFADARTLLTEATPRAGDVVLARVKRLRHHAKLQCARGRRVQLFHGDEILVCFGDRYAPQQFEAYVPATLGPCHLVASGGVAAQAVNWHERIHRGPTEIEVLGILGDAEGRALNLRRYALHAQPAEASRPRLIVVAGTSMDSGKTTAGAHLVRGLTRAGLRVGAAKVTGTGACNDYFLMRDAGAAVVLDFTDAGHVSTYRAGEPAIRRVVETLTAELSRHGLDAAVLEVADGLVQAETAALLSAAWFRQAIDGVIFCAQDAMGAKAGVEWLEQRGHDVMAVSGLLTAAPLAMREAGELLEQPIIGLDGLSDRYVSRSLVACDTRDAELANACAG